MGIPYAPGRVVTTALKAGKREPVGVRKHVRDGRTVGFQAMLTAGGWIYQSTYAVSTYGYWEARRRAVADRRAWEIEVFGAPVERRHQDKLLGQPIVVRPATRKKKLRRRRKGQLEVPIVVRKRR